MSESKGLGDTIDKFTTATGIKKVVQKATGGGCGCNKRKEQLNSMFPYSGNSTGRTSKDKTVGGINKT